MENSKNVDPLQERILNDKRVLLCSPIYQEILQGIKSEKELEEVKSLLISLDFLSLNSYFAAEGAASIFRKLQKIGVTVRKPNDCIVAFYAIHFKLKLVHHDSDFDKIATHTRLKVYSKQ